MSNIDLWSDCDRVPFSYQVHVTQYFQRKRLTGGQSVERVRLSDGSFVDVRNALSAYQQECRFEAAEYIGSIQADDLRSVAADNRWVSSVGCSM